MKNDTDPLSVLPVLEQAANEDDLGNVTNAAPSGWSAYEVWRTQIKDVQDRRSTGPWFTVDRSASARSSHRNVFSVSARVAWINAMAYAATWHCFDRRGCDSTPAVLERLPEGAGALARKGSVPGA
jgi:hypothetical protein